MNDELLNADIDAGFPLNDDETVDLFDYVVWLTGEKNERVSSRVPVDHKFNLTSVNPTELVGFLNAYNHLGYEVKRGKLTLGVSDV